MQPYVGICIVPAREISSSSHNHPSTGLHVVSPCPPNIFLTSSPHGVGHVFEDEEGEEATATLVPAHRVAAIRRSSPPILTLRYLG